MCAAFAVSLASDAAGTGNDLCMLLIPWESPRNMPRIWQVARQIAKTGSREGGA